MLRIGFVGADAGKWSDPERVKRELKQYFIEEFNNSIRRGDHGHFMFVSGGCPKGGVDVWAEALADGYGLPKLIFKAEVEQWHDLQNPDIHLMWARTVNKVLKGYRSRNIEIANASDILYVLSPKGNTFCKHCKTSNHVSNGGCWTGNYAEKLGRKVIRIIIDQSKKESS